MTAYTKTLSLKFGLKSGFARTDVPVGSIFYYSTGGTPELWKVEKNKIKINIVDALVNRIRTLKVTIADPRNIRTSIYTPYLRVKVVEYLTGKTIFLGRVERVDPSYDSNYGQIVVVTIVDYMRELFERNLNSNYSVTPGAVKRSALIAQMISDYTYAGTVTTNIETSGSSDTIARNYLNNNQPVINTIETMAEEDFWTDETWSVGGKVFAFVSPSTYTDRTAEADSSAGTPFNFLNATTDYFYLGQNNPFLGATFDLNVNGNYSSTVTWEYWNGAAWTALVVTQDYQFTADGTVRWDLPTDWATTAVNSVTKYWVRAKCTSKTTTATIYSILCVRGCGYDYYVDDSQVFQYFRRGSKPVGGAAASGLTIQLNGSETSTLRNMNYDYSFVDDPKQFITRVTVYGTASDGSRQSYTATNSALETQYQIVKEDIEYVWGSDMSAAVLLTYVTNRAKALLAVNSGVISRGTFSFYRYPYFGGSNTLCRAGDLVHIIISPRSIDDDYWVQQVIYDEPTAKTTMQVIGLIFGRNYSNFDLSSVLQGLRTGQDISVATARIQDLIAGTAQIGDLSVTTGKIANLAVTDAKIGSLAVDKLTAGNLTVSETLTSGAIQTASSGQRVVINALGITAYDVSSIQRVAIYYDGSGWFGSPTTFNWTAAGVLTVAAANVSGTLTAATISGSNISGGTISGVIISQASGNVIINSSGITVDSAGGTGLLNIKYDSTHNCLLYLDSSGHLNVTTAVEIDLQSNTVISGTLKPSTGAYFDVGDSTNYWNNVYAAQYYGKSTSIVAFQNHDDIGLIKNIKANLVEGKHYIEKTSLHPDLLSKDGDYVDVASFVSLAIGAIKQLTVRVEALEAK